MKNLPTRPSSLGRNTCYSFDEGIGKLAQQIDKTEESPIFFDKIKHDSRLRKFFKLFLYKMIFQGKIDFGILNSEKMISPVWDMNIFYDNFLKKMKNIAHIPLDTISIFYEETCVQKNVEDTFKDFLQHLSVKRKQKNGILFSLSSENDPIFLGECISAANGVRHVTLPVQIADKYPNKYVQLSVQSGTKTFFYCKNCNNETVELPLSMEFCISFKKILDSYLPIYSATSDTFNKNFPTLIGMAGGIFLLFLTSHGIFKNELDMDGEKTAFDCHHDFIAEKCDSLLQYFDTILFLRKKTFDLFLEDVKIDYIDNYYNNPKEPFIFNNKYIDSTDKETERNNKISILKKLMSNKSLSKEENTAIHAEYDRVCNNICMKEFYDKYSDKILTLENDSTHKFWERFNYKIKIIMKKNKIYNYRATKFSHKQSVQK